MLAAKDELFTRPSGYTIGKSVRLRSSASAYFNRTFGTPTNNIKWTWSGWVKRGTLSGYQRLFGVGSDASGINQGALYIDTAGPIAFFQGNGAGSTEAFLSTNAVYRDPAAWYHIVFVYDSGNATSSNRLMLYINGVQVTSFSSSTYPSVSLASKINVASVVHGIGVLPTSPSNFFDGYLTEINFIDGQALTPSSFGITNATTGVWQPAKYTGTYGTNGFYLNFSSNGTSAALGTDFSGNSNTWTVNNVSVTAGVTYDSMTDVPTLTSATAANYAVWNPLDKGAVTVSDGNLTAVPTASGTNGIKCSMGLPLSGKFYWEITVSGLGYGVGLGIANAASDLITGPASAATRTYQFGSWFNTYNSGVVQYGTNQAITGGTNWSGASQPTGNDVIIIAVDMDNGSMWVGKNGIWFNSSGTANPATNTDPRWTGLTGTTWFPYMAGYGTTSPVTCYINFGQQGFKYTPPTGFVALNTYNLPASTITNGAKYMSATTYAGSASQQVINSNMTALDFAWIKNRTTARSHALVDTVRGGSPMLTLYSELTTAEDNGSPNYNPTSISGSSITLGGAKLGINNSGENFVMWGWYTNGGSTSSNTNGSITSTVSVGATQGFSVVTYTGIAGGVAKTFGHGLGVAPSMVIVKGRDVGSTGVNDWVVWHSAFTGSEYIYLDLTNAKGTSANYWGATAPSSTVVTVGGNASNVSNESGIRYVAYCFSAVKGFSAFGSYTGNGSTDGPFVFTGFRPRYVMTKRTDSTGNWYVWDSARLGYNGGENLLYPDLSIAESSYGSAGVDLISNGFKIRNTDASENASGGTYIYMAFAENPFQNALAR